MITLYIYIGLHQYAVYLADKDRNSPDSPIEVKSNEITLFMAFSDNYTIGNLCASANRMYAKRHGYRFKQDV